jgi:pyruvate, orthophosphate dikinase
LEDKYKPIYFFNYTDENNRKLFGEKGIQLLQMAKQGDPISPGFIITSAMCLLFFDNKEKLLQFLMVEIRAAIRKLERLTGNLFGDSINPSFVSVYSSPAVPVRGIINSILYLGMNESTVLGLKKQNNQKNTVWESYIRFIISFSTIVLGVNEKIFKEIKNQLKINQHIYLMRNKINILS